jgi:DNA-directed RNA polymerase specialized sigma subunit
MDFNTTIDELAVNYSTTGNEQALSELLDILKPIMRAVARKYNYSVPTTSASDFEALLHVAVWRACRNISNFDPDKGHVMPRIRTYWRYTMLAEARKAKRRQTVSIEALPDSFPALVVHLEETSEITHELQRFKLYRPMDYAIITALMDGADNEQLAGKLGRAEYDAVARQRVCRAKKAFGRLLCG